VIQCGQNAKEKSNSWKTLLIAGLTKRRVIAITQMGIFPGMSNVIQPLGQVHIYGAYMGHILLALFFKTLSLAIGQKLLLAFRLSWLAILLATVHASSSQANQRSRPSSQ